MSGCGCFVAKHPDSAAIDSALRAGMDPREVATRFGVGKSRVYDHRRHLGIAVVVRSGDPGTNTPGAATTDTPGPQPSLLPRGAPKNVPDDRPATSPASPRLEPVKTTPTPPVPRVEPFHGTVEPRVESGGMNAPPLAQSLTSIPRALPVEPVTRGAYAQAVATVTGLIVNGHWRATHVAAIAEKLGLAASSVRAAHNEAVRHLQMGMGDYLARQAASAMWVTKERDAAKEQSMAAQKNADRWRRQEREEQERADKLLNEERSAALDRAAKFGMLATKYDLSAEKWSAQALAHQRHMDDVLCLRSPKELTQNNFNLGADGATMVERFGTALAARFRDRPDVLAEIEAAASDMERGGPDVIDATGEAA